VRRPEIPRDVFFAEEETAARRQTTGDSSSLDDTAALDLKPQQRPEKIQVSIYLTKPTAKILDAVRFKLIYEHDVKVSKSDLAEFAISRLGDQTEEIIDAAQSGVFDYSTKVRPE